MTRSFHSNTLGFLLTFRFWICWTVRWKCIRTKRNSRCNPLTQYTPPTRRNCRVESRQRCVLSCRQLATVSTSLNKFADDEIELRRVGGVNARRLIYMTTKSVICYWFAARRKRVEPDFEGFKVPDTPPRFVFPLRDRFIQEGIGFKLLASVEGKPPPTVSRRLRQS